MTSTVVVVVFVVVSCERVRSFCLYIPTVICLKKGYEHGSQWRNSLRMTIHPFNHSVRPRTNKVKSTFLHR